VTGKPGKEARSRVVVRAPTADDHDELVMLNRASRRFHRGWASPPVTPEGYEGFLERCGREDFVGLLVCRKQDGAIVGTAILSQIVRGPLQSAYLGYYVGAPFAGRGYMSEGLRLVLDHAFGKLRLHRVEANVQPSNEASLALVERLGFTREGYSRRYLKIGGRWRDHERWAMLAEDWRAVRSSSRRPRRDEL
jgi:[ribosomal protein S5]-alanine N-acetyltransferase